MSPSMVGQAWIHISYNWFFYSSNLGIVRSQIEKKELFQAINEQISNISFTNNWFKKVGICEQELT